MQRSQQLAILVHCPHHGRAVRATRNAAIDRVSSCEERNECRAKDADGTPTGSFPRGCPVYPSLTGEQR